jgi:hypothetical protein
MPMPRGVKGSGEPRQPRKRKATDYQALIDEKENTIQEYKDEIAIIQKEIKELRELKNKQDAEILLHAVQASNLSIESVVDIIKQGSENKD